MCKSNKWIVIRWFWSHGALFAQHTKSLFQSHWFPSRKHHHLPFLLLNWCTIIFFKNKKFNLYLFHFFVFVFSSLPISLTVPFLTYQCQTRSKYAESDRKIGWNRPESGWIDPHVMWFRLDWRRFQPVFGVEIIIPRPDSALIGRKKKGRGRPREREG